ncbi:Nuclear pore complex protein DDB_G0274915 [Planktothrix rubescens NIVA-CYA 18]|nr:Nuclear pore complex protein DDB_G0274915 [Planktothrix rubescens NIVA-CYA 18]
MTKQIIFVDPSVQDHQSLYQSLINNADDTQIVILNESLSGIEQITNTLANQKDIESVQILSHGNQGSLKLGTDVLNGTDIENFNIQLQQWGNALTENGDILLYGCEVAAGETGKNFIKQLSEITGADVAASNDLTGNQALGGDWDLEIATGNIEAAVPFNQKAMADYDYTLANFDVSVATDDGTGTVAGTLSKAILDANTAAGDDTITLTTNVRFTAVPQVLIDSNIAFIGGNFTVSGDVNNNSSNDAGDVRPFFIKSGTVSFSNLTITGGRAQGGNGSGTNSGGGGGAAGMGGALFIYNGDVTIDNVIFTSNQAIGGSSANNNRFLAGGGGFGGNSGVGMAGSSGGNGGGGFGGNGGSNTNASSIGGNGGSGGAFGGSGGAGGNRTNGGNGTGGGGGGGGFNWTNGGNGAFGGGGGSAGDQSSLSGGWGGFGGGGGAAAGSGGRGGFGGGGGVSIHTNTPGAGGFGGGAGGRTTNYSPLLPGGGGAGMGGAIFVREGSLTLQNTTFTNNTTTGGTGANNGKALAGAIFVLDAAAQTAQTTQGNTQGMPAALPTVNVVGYLRSSGNSAAQNASATTDNNDIYGSLNTAPTLADTAVTLTSVLEDAVAPTGAVGTLVSQIVSLGGNVTDPNTSPLTGIALTAADTTNGSWFYTIDGGTTWNPLGAVSSTSARLLAADANTRIYFQPNTNYFGTLTNAITFQAWDQVAGTNGSTANTNIKIGISTATDTAAIIVTPVNDIPSFTATDPTAVNEDSGAQTVANWATFSAGPTNESAQTATYTVSNISTPSLFATVPTIDASGNLTYTPAADANGTSTFDVVVQDNGGTPGVDTSTVQNFSITVNPVNDKPSFSNAGNQILTAWTNTVQTVSNWANTVIFGPANESTQAVSNYTLTNTDNTLFTIQPSVATDGTLTYTPSGKPGTATVSVQLQDDGGTANTGDVDLSDAATFNITVPAPKVNLTASTTTASEAGTTAITFTATAEGNVVGNQTIDLALTGTASAADFTGAIPTQITIPDGNSTGQVTITVNDDLIAEGDETGILTISNPSTGIALGTTNQSVTITDNDTKGITVTPTTVLTTTEAGGNATFTVVLNSQPTADVTIPLTSSNSAEGTVDKSSLTFTAANWNTPQTVTVTGVDDLVVDGNIAYNIVTAAATSTDTNYSGVNATDVAVSNTDNDTKGITVTPTTGLTTTEAGGNATFTVVLNSQPTADVTIPLTSSNIAEGTIDKTSLTFTTANWNTPQTVTVTGVDDLVVDGNIAYNIVTAAATSTDTNYSGVDATDVAVSNTDNDTKGITVTPTTGLTTTEAGGNATFTVVLNSQPTANVTIPLTSSNTAEGTIDKSSLTFTTANWNVAQTVTVTGVEDLVDDGDIAYNIVTAAATSTDANYSGFDASDVAVTNTDNDTKGITVTPTTGLTTTEAGGNATFTVVLNSQPTADVTIPLTSSNIAEGTIDKTSLTFTTANWNTPQTVTVTGVDDLVVDGNIAYNIVTAAATSTDTNYSGVDATDVAVSNTDNDTKGITVTPTTGLTTTEAGGNATFTVVLNSQPTANVTIPLTSSNTAEGTIDKSSLTFTTANWNVAQTVTVTGVEDLVDDGDIAYNIVTAAATSTDANYSGFDASDVAVTNTDNDTKGITVTPTTGLTTTEAGGTANFTVVLNSQPTADVTIPLTSSNTAEGTIDKSSLTFTAANWNTPQTVTITGVDDLVVDGNIAYNIVTAAATSTDTNYSGVDATDVAVSNTDNDTKGITVTPTTGLTTTEAGELLHLQ